MSTQSHSDLRLYHKGMRHIAVLKNHTEGLSPDVVDGTKITLENEKAGILAFEYHGLSLWAETSVQSSVVSLKMSGYACHLDGSPTLTWLDA